MDAIGSLSATHTAVLLALAWYAWPYLRDALPAARKLLEGLLVSGGDGQPGTQAAAGLDDGRDAIAGAQAMDRFLLSRRAPEADRRAVFGLLTAYLPLPAGQGEPDKGADTEGGHE